MCHYFHCRLVVLTHNVELDRVGGGVSLGVECLALVVTTGHPSTPAQYLLYNTTQLELPTGLREIHSAQTRPLIRPSPTTSAFTIKNLMLNGHLWILYRESAVKFREVLLTALLQRNTTQQPHL